MFPPNVLVTLVKVRLVPPSVVALSLIVAMVPDKTVTVTVRGPGGATCSEILTACCRSSPTVTLLIVIFGAVTVAVICVFSFDGMSNPAGYVRDRSVVPPVSESKTALASTLFGDAGNVIGLVMVPTVGSELVIGTSTVKPARTG